MERKLVSVKVGVNLDIGREYLKCAISNFKAIQNQGERVLSQLSYEQIMWSSHKETNSIAIIIKHLHGNMRSRWTDFLTSDGEKQIVIEMVNLKAATIQSKKLLLRGKKGGIMFFKLWII